MLPPRYLLREAALFRLLDGEKPGAFIEIGCGGGELLVALAKRGYTGVGTDISRNARGRSRKRLAEERTDAVTVSDTVPTGRRFDLVFLLEVLGYAESPAALLADCGALLADGGRLIVSFARPGSGYLSHVVHDMKFYTKEDVIGFAETAGLRATRVVNYGFPLANALVPVMNAVHGFRLSRAKPGDSAHESGLHHSDPLLAPLALVSNRMTLLPFAMIQAAFADTDLGNGYLLEAVASR
jgi:SAM-dependent methyltransferase